MLRIVVGAQFERDARRLPRATQDRLAREIAILAVQPFDTRLHTKPLTGSLQGLFSFRIGRGYRALFRFADAETIFLVRVASRKDIYR